MEPLTVDSARLRSVRAFTQGQLAEHADIHTRYLQNSKQGAGPSVSLMSICHLRSAFAEATADWFQICDCARLTHLIGLRTGERAS